MEGSELTWSSFDFSNETQFEEIVIKKNILKQYFVYDAKKTLNIFRKYNRYADVLLIERDFKYWSIGEVEISKHSFKGHVFPQLIEIYSLMEQNINLIRENYLKIDNLEGTKQVKDLIRFNKPFLSLIIDKIPSNYINIIPLLNSFCNVNTIIRMKDSNENYSYISDNYYQNNIVQNISTCYINDIVLIIDYPNLLGMNNINYDSLEYKGEKIYIKQHFNKIDGVERLFWIMENKINDGKYYIRIIDNKLILTKY